MPDKDAADKDAADTAQFIRHGEALQRAVAAVIRPWLRSLLGDRGVAIDADLEVLVEKAALDVEHSIDQLVAADADVPLSGPLERIRQAVQPLNEALASRGVVAPNRNVIDEQMRPSDVYDLGPMTFRDLGDDVHDAGITWGAAKAHLHLRRRQSP